MKLQIFAAVFFGVLVGCVTAIVDHDKIHPFPQPEPITVAEKAAIKFKPQLRTTSTCASFPAVSDTGEVTGGLKGTNGNDACEKAPLGSQIYGRAGWYRNLWAITYAWYFPKRFTWPGVPSGRHDWKSVVVWLDNPAVEHPRIVGVSLSMATGEYVHERMIHAEYFVGTTIENSKIMRRTFSKITQGSRTSFRFQYVTFLGTRMTFSDTDGEYQDLIMWEQLTDAARTALNKIGNFGEAEAPFNDNNYEKHLEKAWIFG
ncbi:hypothetical protein PHMEG_00014817 [Phytophthora megakarya]|uniref:Necrosis inducing protein NPP1 n=1 Tax=Phytophthora megakarya TaxID=4795 RepID=A0A225W5C9_9STRA|nr:hypothetical protein PHMEG_00014817 [Phytophthora megakarya]